MADTVISKSGDGLILIDARIDHVRRHHWRTAMDLLGHAGHLAIERQIVRDYTASIMKWCGEYRWKKHA